jgi:ketosteroid isomerase-like protein
MFSAREDVSLANPFGGVARGPKQVAETQGRNATNYRDGDASGFETISKYFTEDLAYLVEVERGRAKIAGGQDFVPVTLRATSIFRREEGTWKVIHRHADPFTSYRPPGSEIAEVNPNG